MGFCDRGGGREAKGASLRRSKKNPGAAAARAKTEGKVANPPTKIHAQAPNFTDKHPIMDCSVAILSRKFDSDRDRIVDRAAAESGCAAMLVWCGEVERQEALSQMCSDYRGRMFSAIGVHPDNVDRTNKKAHQEWIESTEAIAKNGHCVAILTGLDTTREQATHFSQEALMRELFNCSLRMRVPALIHLNPDAATANRFVEWWSEALVEKHIEHIPMVFHDGVALAQVSPIFAKFLLECNDAYVLASGRGIYGDSAKAAGDILSALPLDRILLSSDSPWHTPHNLPDEHLRTLHNDPANVSFVVEALAELMEIEQSELKAAFKKNTIQVFYSLYDASQPKDHSDSDDDESCDGSDGDDAAAAKAEPVKEETTAPASDVDVSLGSLIVAPNASSSRHFACIKCRTKSFTHSSLVTHAPDAPRVTFKGKSSSSRGDGSCDNTAFFLVVNTDTNCIRGGYGITVGEGDAALCAGCECKMGTIAHETTCPCGARMEGATVRITASRVEAMEDALTDQELLARAAEERTRNIKERAAEAAAESSDDDDKKKRKPKANVKQNNRSNMSNFRNKNFTPGIVAQTENMLAEVGNEGGGGKSKKKKKKGKRGQDSDDE